MIEIDVAQQYASTMASVDFINNGKPDDYSDEHWKDSVDRNIAHLKIMLAKDFWTEEYDLTPFKQLVEVPVVKTKTKV